MRISKPNDGKTSIRGPLKGVNIKFVLREGCRGNYVVLELLDETKQVKATITVDTSVNAPEIWMHYKVCR